MSIFGKIKDAIFGKKAEAPTQTSQPQAAPTPTPQPSPYQDPVTTAPGDILNAPIPTFPHAGTAEPVDVEAVLTQKLADKGNPDLNWRSSIVDLMKLLDLDSSLDNRKELATELGYTGDKDGSAEMNIWLHKRVMSELAKNGGKVPAGLAD